MAARRRLGFSEEQFRATCRELDQPPPAVGRSCQLLADSMGVRIYRLYDEQSGFYEYKVFGCLADCPPRRLVDFYMDLDFRKQWDLYAKELYEKTYDGEKVVYWEVKYPFPLSNRDYVYIRECQELDVNGQKIWVVLAQGVSVPQCPERPGIIRVKTYKQNLAVESDGKTGSKVYMYYVDNPGGRIPLWLVNWAAKSGVPAFMKDAIKACRCYCRRS
ncbi:phosphatidylcholine transfer protein isoform X1 [Phalacrocorax aristotelis]|uniref:phosphatidylcholine transfer protein isoform X1 n=2 Tax=Phalacrocorax aristotelis TaxID=126867 RepID=UPI003F4B8F17